LQFFPDKPKGHFESFYTFCSLHFYKPMTNWTQKYGVSSSQECTAKTAKTPKADKSVTANFVRLVRITAICERHLYLDDATILAELDADDLAELKTLKNWDKQHWATLQAHRICDERTG